VRPEKDSAHGSVGANITVLGGGVTGKADIGNGLPEHYVPAADVVQAAINGQRDAAQFLQDLNSRYVHPDRLFEIVLAIAPAIDTAAASKLRGLMRAIQKKLEVPA
jgi:hypothetical protein